MEHFFELVLAGLTRGSIYALVAIGYTMVYGIIGLINFAHGEIYMLGAFVGLIVAGALAIYGFDGVTILVISLTMAMLFAAAYGWTVEKIAYRPLRAAPRLSALISAIGVSIFLQNYVLLTQGPEFRAYPNLLAGALGGGEWADESETGGELLANSEWALLIAAASSMLLLAALIKLTRLGLAMRAVAQDREMAMLLGVNANQAVSAAFVIGSIFAAVGGVLVAVHIGQVGFYFGFIAGIKAFTAAVLGGIGSVPGAALGGLVLGMTESLAAGYISSDYEDVIAFLLLIIVLIFKPEGLLGRKEVIKV